MQEPIAIRIPLKIDHLPPVDKKTEPQAPDTAKETQPKKIDGALLGSGYDTTDAVSSVVRVYVQVIPKQYDGQSDTAHNGSTSNMAAGAAISGTIMALGITGYVLGQYHIIQKERNQDLRRMAEVFAKKLDEELAKPAQKNKETIINEWIKKYNEKLKRAAEGTDITLEFIYSDGELSLSIIGTATGITAQPKSTESKKGSGFLGILWKGGSYFWDFLVDVVLVYWPAWFFGALVMGAIGAGISTNFWIGLSLGFIFPLVAGLSNVGARVIEEFSESLEEKHPSFFKFLKADFGLLNSDNHQIRNSTLKIIYYFFATPLLILWLAGIKLFADTDAFSKYLKADFGSESSSPSAATNNKSKFSVLKKFVYYFLAWPLLLAWGICLSAGVIAKKIYAVIENPRGYQPVPTNDQEGQAALSDGKNSTASSDEDLRKNKEKYLYDISKDTLRKLAILDHNETLDAKITTTEATGFGKNELERLDGFMKPSSYGWHLFLFGARTLITKVIFSLFVPWFILDALFLFGVEYAGASFTILGMSFSILPLAGFILVAWNIILAFDAIMEQAIKLEEKHERLENIQTFVKTIENGPQRNLVLKKLLGDSPNLDKDAIVKTIKDHITSDQSSVKNIRTSITKEPFIQSLDASQQKTIIDLILYGRLRQKLKSSESQRVAEESPEVTQMSKKVDYLISTTHTDIAASDPQKTNTEKFGNSILKFFFGIGLIATAPFTLALYFLNRQKFNGMKDMLNTVLEGLTTLDKVVLILIPTLVASVSGPLIFRLLAIEGTTDLLFYGAFPGEAAVAGGMFTVGSASFILLCIVTAAILYAAIRFALIVNDQYLGQQESFINQLSIRSFTLDEQLGLSAKAVVEKLDTPKTDTTRSASSSASPTSSSVDTSFVGSPASPLSQTDLSSRLGYRSEAAARGPSNTSPLSDTSSDSATAHL